MAGPCPCGMFPCHGGYQCCAWRPYDDAGEYYSPSVDCTLSLGNPSTRRSPPSETQEQRRSSNFFGWDFLYTKSSSSSSSSSNKKLSGAGPDPLLGRRCTNCDTTSTPLWRNGPRGPKSLCNACGIRYKKEERRANAAAASNAAYMGGGEPLDTQAGYYNGGWAQYQPEKLHHYYLHVHDYTN